jgi:ketosteroid isomerase-like protein
MLHGRRSILAAGVGGVAGLAMKDLSNRPVPVGDDVARDLAQKSEQGNAALLRGDVETYFSFVKPSDDFTLMSPFGGTPSHGTYSEEERQKIGSFFRNGSLRQELVHSYSAADMVVLVVIEHCRGEIGGLPMQDWSLRVSLVYQRREGDWLLVHRHADPLANGITVKQSAALANGGKAM